MNDPYWVEACKPVEKFLATSYRSWEDLKAWRSKQRGKNALSPTLLNHMLAWLEGNGRARTITREVKTKRGYRVKVFWGPTALSSPEFKPKPPTTDESADDSEAGVDLVSLEEAQDQESHAQPEDQEAYPEPHGMAPEDAADFPR